CAERADRQSEIDAAGDDRLQGLAASGRVDHLELQTMLLEDSGLVAEVGNGRIPVAALANGHLHEIISKGSRRTEPCKRYHSGCQIVNSCHAILPDYRLVSFYAVEPAELANQCIGADRQDEQNDQHRIHPRHVENTVGLDDQEADAFVRELGFREQSTDQRDAAAETYAV